MGLLTNLFKKKPKSDKKVIESTESYLNSSIIYANDAIDLTLTNQTKEMDREEKIQFIYENIGLIDVLFTDTSNIIMLFDFSADYNADAAEFLASGLIPAKFVQGGYEKELEEEDTHGDPVVVHYTKYYILIGGSIENYINLFKFIPNLSNPFIKAIKKELYKGIHKCFFRELIFDDIMNEDEFVDNPPHYANYTIQQSDDEKGIVDIISYDPIDVILEKLPDVFTGEDLLYFTKINMIMNRNLEQCAISANINIAIINNMIFIAENDPVVITLVDIIFREGLYDSVFKDINMQKLQQLTMPVYSRALIPEDNVFGKMTDVEISELFKEDYDKFTGVIRNDEDIIYEESVDEIITDDSIEADDGGSDDV